MVLRSDSILIFIFFIIVVLYVIVFVFVILILFFQFGDFGKDGGERHERGSPVEQTVPIIGDTTHDIFITIGEEE